MTYDDVLMTLDGSALFMYNCILLHPKMLVDVSTSTGFCMRMEMFR